MLYKNSGKFMIRASLNFVAAATLLLLGACETASPPIADSKSTVRTIAETSAGSSGGAPGAKQSGSDVTTQPSSTSNSASPPVPKTAEPAPVVKPEQLLSEGKDLYDKGDYKAAIRKLSAARDAVEDSSVTKQSILKFLAFSYCVTNQKPLCKQQFTSLLKLAPAFQLSRGEAGHPLWGPVFKDAKDSKTDSKTDSKLAIQAKPTK
jgi:hypothetical protein